MLKWMSPRKILIAAAALWGLILSAGLLVAWRAAPEPVAVTAPALPRVQWDLSAGRGLSAVGWPLGPSDKLWLIDGPGVLDLTLPGGRRGTFAFTLIEVRQEGGQVRTVGVYGPAGPLDRACAHAASLMKHWDLGGRESPDKWAARRRRDMGYTDPAGPDWPGTRSTDEAFPRWGLSVRTTHRDAAPWLVEWGAVLAPPRDAPPWADTK